jgi:hypothetical protein
MRYQALVVAAPRSPQARGDAATPAELGRAACSRSRRGRVRVSSPRERTRPRARSLDTPVTEDPPPTLGDRGRPRVSVAVVINAAIESTRDPITPAKSTIPAHH